MSKAQYILLMAVVGFYVLLTATLLLRACAQYFQTKSRRAAVARSARVSKGVEHKGGREWTRAVWRSNQAFER
jgi:hypothetical protein